MVAEVRTPHADGGKSLSSARRGGEECDSFLCWLRYTLFRAKAPAQFSGYCGASLHLQDSHLTEHYAAPWRVIKTAQYAKAIQLVSSCVVHGRPCVPEGSGNPHLRLERASEWGTHAFRRGWANEALERLEARQRCSIAEVGAELPPSHTWRRRRGGAVEAAEFTCRIFRLRLMGIYLGVADLPRSICPNSLCCGMLDSFCCQ